jgi:hypothetical protein
MLPMVTPDPRLCPVLDHENTTPWGISTFPWP